MYSLCARQSVQPRDEQAPTYPPDLIFFICAGGVHVTGEGLTKFPGDTVKGTKEGAAEAYSAPLLHKPAVHKGA